MYNEYCKYRLDMEFTTNDLNDILRGLKRVAREVMDLDNLVLKETEDNDLPVTHILDANRKRHEEIQELITKIKYAIKSAEKGSDNE